VEISEVRIKLMDDPNERLLGFCSVTFDGWFVIRDLKIIQGSKGPFVAMPSRKLTDRCPRCGTKNHLRARFCNDCGVELDEDRAIKDDDGRAKLYADIAHPINSICRDAIQKRVIESWDKEKILAKQPGYICTYDDYGEDRIAKLKHPQKQPLRTTPTIRFDGPNDSTRRIEPGQSEVARPHHLDSPNSPQPRISAESTWESGFDEGFGIGVQ
jgi:stage V sporulation protein G